jgi:hypothetical protein
MNEKSDASDAGGEMKDGRKRLILLEKAAARFNKKHHEKPQATKTTEEARFGESFEIVVVCVVHDFSIVERFVSGKDGLQCAEASAGDGMIEKNMPGVAAHGGALSFADFEGLHGRETLENLADAQPRDK